MTSTPRPLLASTLHSTMASSTSTSSTVELKMEPTSKSLPLSHLAILSLKGSVFPSDNYSDVRGWAKFHKTWKVAEIMLFFRDNYPKLL